MTLDNLKAELARLGSGERTSIPYETYEDLFPPGGEDQGARERCHRFAREAGCWMESVSADRTIWFAKNA